METILNHITEIIAVLTTAGGYLYGRATKKSEVKTAEAGALKSIQEVYDTFVVDVNARIEGLKTELTVVKGEVNNWKDKYNLLYQKYSSLKSEFEYYKKKHP